ncbi:uncharacterized protein LOC133174043 [Saccostrea echinata]|uniref:uncharacterized protein LOC133174043 n=1 Tax=Saccostrea echinata TaxID=191078 RepID=UPI002A7F4579|nr:uncharacterized protein LOC133174043 [Saccostrea echinata]
MYDEKVKSVNIPLETVSQNIVAADGTPLKVKGRGNFLIKLGDHEFDCQAVMANIKTDGILGLDFLQSSQCLVDIARTKMFASGVEHDLHLQGQIGCFRVSLEENITIPSRSEMICSGQLLSSPGIKVQGPLLIEPIKKFDTGGKALIARTLVDPAKNVTVRLMNISEQIQTIYKNTVVGVTSPVDVVKSEDENMVSTVTLNEKVENIPDHLNELYTETTKGLTAEKASKIKTSLIKFQHLFSKTKDDFGRTSLIKHKINTEGARPTKQPPRRLPHHTAEFVDKEVENMIRKGIVEPSSSPWAAGVVLVEKKDGTKRFCVDYRSLNRCLSFATNG